MHDAVAVNQRLYDLGRAHRRIGRALDLRGLSVRDLRTPQQNRAPTGLEPRRRGWSGHGKELVDERTPATVVGVCRDRTTPAAGARGRWGPGSAEACAN